VRVLVTGGAGFIGSHLVDRLLASGHEMRILDSLDPQVPDGVPAYLAPEAELVISDVRDDVPKLTCWLAGQTAVDRVDDSTAALRSRGLAR
jgi:nucleoside-diphosphate-sugar epimerase